MAEFFDYFKVIMDYLKTNKWLLLWATGTFMGLGGNIYQAVDEPKTKEIVVEKPLCGNCSKLLNNHKQEYH